MTMEEIDLCVGKCDLFDPTTVAKARARLLQLAAACSDDSDMESDFRDSPVRSQSSNDNVELVSPAEDEENWD